MLVVLPLILALLSSLTISFVNVLDKFIVAKKVKNIWSYSFVAAMINVATGIILACFLNWSTITAKSLLFPALAGTLIGVGFLLYLFLMKTEDVSGIIGFKYFFPVIVALLSFLFLNELLSLLSYFGIGLVLLGVVLLSVRMKKTKFMLTAWLIGIYVITAAFYEFFIKLSTNNLPALQGLAVNMIFIGFAVAFILFSKQARRGIRYELKNTKWAVLNETLTFVSIGLTYFAMSSLSATVVSSILATQPLMVLGLEKVFIRFGIKITRDEKFLRKLLPIGLIVVGVILLYFTELV
jgi:uncharacterized membrane protein